MSGKNKQRFFKSFFFCTYVLTAVLLVLGTHIQWFDPARWWFLGLLPIMTVYLLIALFLFAVIGWFIRPVWLFIPVLVCIISYKQIMQIFPPRLASSFHNQKEERALRIMSWNVEQFEILHYVQHPEMKQQMLDLIHHYQPDIACFQEMVCADTSQPGTSLYQSYSLDSFSAALHFPYHFYAYNPKEDYLHQQHFGMLIFSKYPIIRKQLFSYYPNDYNSIFECVDILVQKDTFRIFNIHLQSLEFSASNRKYIDNSLSLSSKEDIENSRSILSKFKQGFLKRHLQAERIKDAIHQSPYPVIVCGDFNDVPNSYAYETIGKGLKNAFVEKGAGIGGTYSDISFTLRIDNIFLDPRFSVRQYMRERRRLSDHFPVVADAVFSKR